MAGAEVFLSERLPAIFKFHNMAVDPRLQEIIVIVINYMGDHLKYMIKMTE